VADVNVTASLIYWLAANVPQPFLTSGRTLPGSYNLTMAGTFISGSTPLTNSTRLTLVVQ